MFYEIMNCSFWGIIVQNMDATADLSGFSLHYITIKKIYIASLNHLYMEEGSKGNVVLLGGS